MTVIIGKRGDPGPAGWTQVIATEPSGEGVAFTGAGTRKVHVSSSGSDTTGNGTLAAPYATIGKGLSALRSGSPDWLLFKRGDTWSNQSFGRFGRKGKSPDEPIFIGSYGTGARPLFIPHAINQPRFFWRLNGDVTDNIVVMDLDVYYAGRDISHPSYDPAQAAYGTYFSQLLGEPPSLFWMWENCHIRFATVGIHHGNTDTTVAYEGSYRGTLKVRRCVIWKTFQASNKWDAGGHAVLVDHQEDALYEECLIHQAGLDTANPLSFRSTYYHGLYLQASTGKGGDGVVRPGNSTVRDNIITWASYNGVWHRCGGTCENNYITNCGGGIGMGYASGTPPTLVNIVKDNVIQASMGHNGGPHTTDSGGTAAHRGLEPGVPGVGITIWPTVHPGRVTGNLISNSNSTGVSATGISFGTQPEAANYPLSHSWTADKNLVSKWSTLAGGVESQALKLKDYSVAAFGPPNVFDNTNKISLDGVTTTTGEALPDGKRSIETYDKSVLGGPGTLDHFADLYLSKMDRDSWDVKLTAAVINDYVRVGHNMPALGDVVVEPPPTPDEAATVASLTLVNADTGADIGPLGTTIDLAALPTKNLNVRANTSPAAVTSVSFDLDGIVTNEATAPYAMMGDVNGVYNKWTPSVGAHVLKVTPTNAGTVGAQTTANFTVSDTVVPPIPPEPPAVVYRWQTYKSGKSTLYKFFEDDVEVIDALSLDEARWLSEILKITPP